MECDPVLTAPLPISQDSIDALERLSRSRDYSFLTSNSDKAVWELLDFTDIRPSAKSLALGEHKNELVAVESVLLCQSILLGLADGWGSIGDLERMYEYVCYTLAVPTHGGRTIYIEAAYRKWLLLYSLVYQEGPQLNPFGVHPKTLASVRKDGLEYDTLLFAFGSWNRKSFEKFAAQYECTWLEDGNKELVDKLVHTFDSILLKKASECFRTITVERLSKILQLSEEATAALIRSRGEKDGWMRVARAEPGGVEMVHFDGDIPDPADRAGRERLTAFLDEKRRVFDRFKKEMGAIQERLGVTIDDASYEPLSKESRTGSERRWTRTMPKADWPPELFRAGGAASLPSPAVAPQFPSEAASREDPPTELEQRILEAHKPIFELEIEEESEGEDEYEI